MQSFYVVSKYQMVTTKHNISFFKSAHLFLCILSFYLCTTLNAQCNNEKDTTGLSWDFDEEKSAGFSIGTFISNTFTPQLITDTKHIRKYILDERFQILRRTPCKYRRDKVCGISRVVCQNSLITRPCLRD